jgi:hypothetical protein
MGFGQMANQSFGQEAAMGSGLYSAGQQGGPTMQQGFAGISGVPFQQAPQSGGDMWRTLGGMFGGDSSNKQAPVIDKSRSRS